MAQLGNRLNDVQESATLRLNAAVTRMRSEGLEIVNLTAGEPDFPPPESAKAAIVDALKRNENKYTPAPGLKTLRERVASRTNLIHSDVPKKWTFQNTVITNGAKQALFNAFLAILNEGDEVLIPSPYWLSYPDMVKICGGKPVIVETSSKSNFKLTPDTLKDQITSRTKILILNSPSNPTGAIYSRAELEKLGEVLRSHSNQEIWIVSDEIYDQIQFGVVPFCSFLTANPDLQDRVVTINGMSKVFAMTGWRVGWAVAKLDLIEAMSKLQGQSTSGANSLAQWASIAALEDQSDFFAQQLATYRQRRDTMFQILSKTGKLKVSAPDGAFYFFVGLQNLGVKTENSVDFAEKLLKEKRVAVVPGGPFGADQYVRLSFATDDESIKEGCERIVSFVEES